MYITHDGFGNALGAGNELLFDAIQSGKDVMTGEENGVGSGEEGEETVLLLAVVQDLEFGGRVVRVVFVGIVTLAANGGVTNGNGACHGEGFVGGVNDVGANLHHGDVTMV